jgi:hypothetical protein
MSKKVCVVEAVDWGIIAEQTHSTAAFDIVRGTICGFLVSENDELLVLTQQWFNDGGVRCTLAIPKCTIINRTDLELQAKEKGERNTLP